MLQWELRLDSTNINHSDLVSLAREYSTSLVGENKELLERRGYEFFPGKNKFAIKDQSLRELDLKFYNAIVRRSYFEAKDILQEFKKKINLI